jgi:hypothetical protein
MFFGCFGGIITGVSQPLFCVLFGQMLDAINNPSISLRSQVDKVCLLFIYVAIANIFSGFLQVLVHCILHCSYLLFSGVLLRFTAGQPPGSGKFKSFVLNMSEPFCLKKSAGSIHVVHLSYLRELLSSPERSKIAYTAIQNKKYSAI